MDDTTHDKDRRRFINASVWTAAGALTIGSGLLLPSKASAQAQAQSNSRTLVVYLTRTGNTRVIAKQLQRRYDADLFEIRTAESYPEDYEEMVEKAHQQRDSETPPALAENIDIGQYDTVFLGFPIWGGALPAPVRTFLTTNDLAGKTIAPFITHGGYGPGSAPQTLASLTSDAQRLDPFVMECDQERRTIDRISAWLETVEPAV